MSNESLGAFATTLALALLGYLGTYVYSRALQRRKDRLDRVNSQLRDLYGPLLALASSGSLLFARWRETEFPPLLEGWARATPEDKQQWRLWMLAAFMPTNRQMKDIITKQAHLVDEDYMPPALLTFCAHVSAYEVLLQKWDEGDYSRMVPYILFPQAIGDYVTQTFQRLKQRQSHLLYGRTQGSVDSIRTLEEFREAHPEYFVDRVQELVR